MFTTPKENWNTNDGIQYTDLNRIESNTHEIFDTLGGFVEGFDITSVSLDDGFKIDRGRCCFSAGAAPGGSNYNVISESAIFKNLNTFAVKGASATGSVAPGALASLSTARWWYVFVILNSTTGVFDIATDDNPQGLNLAGIGGYDTYRLVSFFYCKPTKVISPIRSYGDNFLLFNANSHYETTVTESITPTGTTTVVNVNVPLGDIVPELDVIIEGKVSYSVDTTVGVDPWWRFAPDWFGSVSSVATLSNDIDTYTHWPVSKDRNAIFYYYGAVTSVTPTYQVENIIFDRNRNNKRYA